MIYASNFKMNHTRYSTEKYISTLDKLLEESKVLNNSDSRVFVFPPATALCKSSKNITIGTQNAFPAQKGAFTGEIGLTQLEEFGIKSIVIGHSERRDILGETQDIVAKKFQFFKEQDFEIIYCIGEPLEIREKGIEATFEYLWSQFEGIDIEYDKLIVAYEPVWAIGGGQSATPEDITLIYSKLKERIEAPLIYGGSVNSSNVVQIKNIENVDGIFVGSASLKVDSFFELITK